MRQYLDQKQEVGDAVLLFRMGDFYETFYDDAKTVARVLGLTLTARNKTTGNPIPMAGVPYHAADTYLARLVRAGYKVAISEQMEDPKQAKGVVKRAVQRIITPGTLTDENLLDGSAANLLVGLCPAGKRWEGGKVGLASVEVSSGRFFAELIPASRVVDEVARLGPAEIIVPEQAIDAAPQLFDELRAVVGAAISPRAPHVFDRHLAEKRLLAQFNVSSLSGFGFDGFNASLAAAAALLDYLGETQRTNLDHISRIVPRHSDGCLMLDQVTLRSLEIESTIRDGERTGTLLGAIDMTVNPMGGRRLREWVCFPLRDATEIRTRQRAVTALRDQPDRLRAIRSYLHDAGDVERILGRLGVGRVTPRDMAALGRTLESLEPLRESIGPAVSQTGSSSADLLDDIRKSLAGLDAVGRRISTCLKDDAPPIFREGNYIADGVDSELDRLRNIEVTGSEWLAKYQAEESARTGIPTLKIGYNSVFGYYIEITNQHHDKVPDDYTRKQTVRNAERYITSELKAHENEVLTAADKAKALEVEIFQKLREEVAAHLPALQAAADAMATLDVIAGFAELARSRDYCLPEVVDADPDATAFVLDIVEGRHPVLDVTLAERFVPNDCGLDAANDRLLILTGPNMAGKSTYIRQVALLTLLAQTGSYVPAKSMRLSPTDRIFARVGASDELARGLSTFMVEMVETSRILNNATAHSLVILDEVGRGTSTYDGLSLAWAITEHIVAKIGCRTLFATHYHELTELAEQLDHVRNYNVAVSEQLRVDGTGRDVAFLHKIIPGAADRSYGVHVAEMAGLPKSVTRRSEKILADLESRFDRAHPGGGRSERKAEDANQLLLFGPQESTPPEWKEVVERLSAIDVNAMTPIDALNALAALKEALGESAP
ncbi:MAG: DNA mismatch repair protein MutS [Phycisphaerales bacterium]|nr:DNA mismatch repair protein MutS [Phycisphaerales bacterium]MCB9863432.1 DNA mismatch repair protein MutS [Phycisphaerales bacterium]